jgi:hypothetical protein
MEEGDQSSPPRRTSGNLCDEQSTWRVCTPGETSGLHVRESSISAQTGRTATWRREEERDRQAKVSFFEHISVLGSIVKRYTCRRSELIDICRRKRKRLISESAGEKRARARKKAESAYERGGRSAGCSLRLEWPGRGGRRPQGWTEGVEDASRELLVVERKAANAIEMGGRTSLPPFRLTMRRILQ